MTTTLKSTSDDPVRDERFRLGIEGSGIGTWDLDLSTQRLLWSSTTRALFGVPRELPLTYNLFLSFWNRRTAGARNKPYDNRSRPAAVSTCSTASREKRD